MIVRLFVVMIACACSLGCPPSGTKATGDASTSSCSKIGQSCEFSPGKLGTCVRNDDCAPGASCFTCQSQH